LKRSSSFGPDFEGYKLLKDLDYKEVKPLKDSDYQGHVSISFVILQTLYLTNS